MDEPTLVKTSRLQTAVIPITVPRNEIQWVMGPGIEELYAEIQAQGLHPTGPWFSHYHRITPELFEFEISVPVDALISPAGRVKASELAAATVLRTLYRGPYEGLAQAWGEFRQWASEHGHSAAEHLWEVYLSGPDSSSNPQDWCTELNMPLVS